MSEFKIYLTDNPNPIIVPYKSKNTETSLVLVGPDSCNYGEDLLSNLLHVMENFCDVSAPDKPLLGQTYYNSDTQKLNVFGKSGWKQIDNIPNPHNSDVVYVDINPSNISGSLVLSDEIKKYISIYGHNTPTKVYSLYEAINPDEAVTIGYVNAKLATPDMYYVTRSGISTMEGPLKLQPIESTDVDGVAVDIGYVNNKGKVKVVSNQVLNTSSENNGVVRVVIYDVFDKINDSGVLDENPRFAAIYFSDMFSSTQKTLTVTLPIMLKYDSSFTCNCTMVNSTDKVIVKSKGNSSVVIEQRDAKENYVFGCIYGTIENNLVNKYIADNNLVPMPIISPTYSSTPRTVLSVPEPEPTPSPSPSISMSAIPPTPSPSESVVAIPPTPSPSESEPVPSPPPSPSISEVAIPPTPSPSESEVAIPPTPSPSESEPLPTPSPSPSESEPLPTPSPSPSGSMPLPSASPTPSPSISPTPSPSVSPSPSPTPTPSPSPSLAMITKLCYGYDYGKEVLPSAFTVVKHKYKMLSSTGNADVTVDYKFIGVQATGTGYYIGLTRDSNNVASPTRPYSQAMNGVSGSFKINGAIMKDETFTVDISSTFNNATMWDYCISYPGGLVRVS